MSEYGCEDTEEAGSKGLGCEKKEIYVVGKGRRCSCGESKEEEG